MPAPRPLPPSTPPAFAVRDAPTLGIPRPRLRRSDLVTPFRGARTTTPPREVVELCLAALPVLRADAFICGPTAARLWEIPLPRRLQRQSQLHVGHPHRVRPSRLAGVVGHHFVITPAELTSLSRIPVTTPARTWCDLAGTLSLEELVAAGDRLIWSRAPLATLGEIAALADVHPGRRGRADRRAALAMLSPDADSPAESTLRIRFRAAGLPRVTPNLEVQRPDGGRARIDLAFEDQRVGVEYEGDHHRVERGQWGHDLRRMSALEDAGWSMIRATGDDLISSAELIERVAGRLRGRGWHPTRP
ncbi:endonuclease domain-containing protein [Salinibacterium sp. ZJ70]|uniref:endonuclease domain-containing protein n=1 Tax=Salinibacterium sp. ZJ70 TaxID=2708084 RepID=UPI001420171E|nr:hypothetical protein [Salinibacterium sp. ZJ70]